VRPFTTIQLTPLILPVNTEITLQGVPNSKYELELFVGNQEIELQKEGNRTWTPAQRSYVPCFLTTYTHWAVHV